MNNRARIPRSDTSLEVSTILNSASGHIYRLLPGIPPFRNRTHEIGHDGFTKLSIRIYPKCVAGQIID